MPLHKYTTFSTLSDLTDVNFPSLTVSLAGSCVKLQLKSFVQGFHLSG